MRTFKLEGKERGIAARSVNQKKALEAMRKNNEIPAILYGGEKVTHSTIAKEVARKLAYIPEISAVELSTNGSKMMTTVEDMQSQPVIDEILYMGLLKVSKDKVAVMEVSVALRGHAKGVRAGGKPSLQMGKPKMKAIYDRVPEKLTVNIDHLGLGKTIQVGTLHLRGLELTNAKNAIVYAVQLTRTTYGVWAKE